MNKELQKRIIEQEKQTAKEMQEWWEKILPKGLLGQLVRKEIISNNKTNG